MGLAFIGAGIIAALIATAYLTLIKTERYDPILKIFMTISLIGLVS